MNNSLIPFLIGLFVSAVLAVPILKGLIALKSRQTVSQFVTEHAHKQGTPTMGGLIILVGALAGLTYWALQGAAQRSLPSFAIVVGFSLIGFVDDFVLPRVKKGSRGLGWIPKLVLQIGLATLSVWLLFSSIGTSSPLNLALGVFTVLFYANAYNFSDGLDWLAGSTFVALGIGIAAITIAAGNGVAWVPQIAAFLGAAIPFMYLNRPPAKVFMGDVGSMAIGGLLGLAVADVMVVALPNTKQPVIAFVGLVFVSAVMIMELVPVPLQILSVKLRKKKIFPFTPIHHAFQRAGWPELKIVGLFFSIQVIGSVIGYFLFSMAVK